VIQDRNALAVTGAHAAALDCLEAGIEAARPQRVLREAVDYDGERLVVGTETHELSAYDEVIVLGGGNAAGHLAAALEDELGVALDGGLVVTDDPVETETIDVLPADHPVPSERGMASTRELLDRARSVDQDTLVLGVVTGGGSACMVAPADGITLEDLRATTEALLESGVDIHEINAVRKHLSAIKGGRLARALAPARVSGLVLSDVVGDDLDVIASGPLVPDSSTFADALNVIEREDLAVPAAVRDRLAAGAAGDVDETPGPEDPVFDRVSAHVVGTNLTALRAARAVAAERGYETLILSSRIRGEARDAAPTHVAVAEEIAASGNPVEPPAVVLSGGETTVSVDGDGQGGPNQEFALAAALDLPDDGVLAAVDTDGIDGNTDAAGALVDGDTVEDRAAARRALAVNDANPFLRERGALLETGPTGTNVNDLRVVVVE
jgi:hydroxypyruvate reductase